MQVPATARRTARFGPFAIDFVAGELHNNGRRIPIQDKPLQLLAILLEKRGELVTREELRQRLWPADTFVDFEHSINTAVKKLRESLGDSSEHSLFIETLPRRGYRFIAPVEESARDFSAVQSGSAGLIGVVPAADQQRHDRKTYPVPATAGLRVSRPHALALVSAAALVLVVVVAGLWRYHAQTALTTTTASVAVLPFADLSPGHDHAYFSEGLAEEILNGLTKIPNLKVAARTSAFQFKERNEDSRTIGRKLNVANLLEGSVQRTGDRVRVSAHLTRADVGLNLWSESYDRDFKDIFVVEDDIAKEVTSALQVKLLTGKSPTTLATSGTTVPEAYEALLHARYFAHMQDEESERKALHYADKAIQFDQNYAPAYALRATIELEAGGMVWMDYSDATERARHDTEKAIALDPNLADGYRVLSMLQSWVESNCREAETSLKMAINLAPGDPDSIGRNAWLAMCQGRTQEAVELWKQEVLLDPLRPDEYLWLAQGLRDLGRYEEARAALVKALDLNPNQISMIHEVGGEVYLAQGRPQEALAEMEKEPAGLFRDLGEAIAYHALGRRQESDAALTRMLAQHPNDGAYQIGQVYASRGQADQAFEWLNRAYRQHDPGLMWFKTDLKLKSLRKDQRYAPLLKNLNLPE